MLFDHVETKNGSFLVGIIRFGTFAATVSPYGGGYRWNLFSSVSVGFDSPEEAGADAIEAASAILESALETLKRKSPK